VLGFHTFSVVVGNQIKVMLVNRKVVQVNQAVCEAPDVG